MLVAVFYLPVWFFLFFIFLFSYIFNKYYEAIFFSLFFDLLYGTNIDEIYGAGFIFVMISVVVVSVFEFIRKRIRFGGNFFVRNL